MTIPTFRILYLCLLLFEVYTAPIPANFDSVKLVKNPQIQKHFLEFPQTWNDIEEKTIISSNRIPSWEYMNMYLEPNQHPFDLSQIGYSEEEYGRLNYFEVATDQSQPLYKLSDPTWASKDPLAVELQNFKFDPPFLNFTESSVYVTSKKPFSIINLSDKYELKIISNRTDDPQLFLDTDETFTKVIKPGIKHKLKIGMVATSLRNYKSAFFFTMQIIQNKKVIATRNFIYDVLIYGVKNPFEFDTIPTVKLYQGDYWRSLFSIYNPFGTVLTIDHVSTDDKELEIKIPWNAGSMKNKELNITEETKNIDLSAIWKIQPEKKQTFLFFEYKGKNVGYKKVNILIETAAQNFFIPIVFKVKPKTLMLDKEVYDLGVVTSPRVPHEIMINITNIFNYPIQILEIYASIPKQAPVRIFRLDGKTVLEPFQQNKLIAMIRLLPTEKNFNLSYEGKILIQTNDTGVAHFVEGKYRIAYYPNMFPATNFDLSYYVRMQGDNIYTDKKDDFHYIHDYEGGGTVVLTKPLYLTNHFDTALEFQKMNFPTEFLTIASHRTSTQLPLFIKTRIFDLMLRMPSKNLNLTHFNTWFAIECYGMIIPFHIYVYDKRLYCSMNVDGVSTMEKCHKAERVNLNFGAIAVNDIRKKTLTLKNYNPTEVTIISINCSIPNCFTDVVEASLDHILNEKNEIIMKDRQLLSDMDPNKVVYKGLAHNHKAVFSFTVNKSVEEFQKGEITIRTVDEVFTMPLSYHVLQGNLTFTPQVVRFSPAFPGKKQEAKVTIRNSFNTTIYIKSMESENPEIIPGLINPTLLPSERIEAFKITFDPSKHKQIDSLKNPASSGEYQYGISLEDLYSWRLAENIWEELVAGSSTEIRDSVQIRTSVSEKTFVQVRASLIPPMLITESIDFGVTKVNERSLKNVTIENPSDLPIYVQLFLGPEEFSNMTFISEMFKSDAGEEILHGGVADKQQFCLIESLLENTDDKAFNEVFLEDKSFTRSMIRHVNLGNVINQSKSDEELDKYANRVYHCIEGNNADSLKLNFTRKFTKRLIQDEENSDNFEPVHLQNIKETFVYEIKAMTYAQPKPSKAVRKAESLWEKIKLYLRDWLDFGLSFGGDKELLQQAALLEKLKQNIKEIYIQNFNSLQKEQQVFLNPEYRDVTFIIPAHSNVTIPALIHQPTSNKEYEIKLYIKNNLTSIFQIPVKALGGSGNLIVTDVKRYDDTKKIFVRSTEELLEGDHDQKKMKFFLDRTKKLKLDKPHKRRFTLKNDGNLPLDVSKISIQNLGCEGYGFSIDEGCSGFILEPNQEWDLEIKFTPDMSLTDFTRTLIISTNQSNFEFDIHVKMPSKKIDDNFDLYQFKTRIYMEVACYVIIGIMTALCFKMMKEIVFNRQGKSGKIYGQEVLNYKHPNEIFENIISVKTNTPMIPDMKISSKKLAFQLDKPLRTSKTPVRASETKEKPGVQTKKFEDSEGEMKFVEKTRRKAAKNKKEAPPTPDHEEVTPLPEAEVQTSATTENKPLQKPVVEKREVVSASLPQQTTRPKTTQVVTKREEAPVQEKKLARLWKDSKPYYKDQQTEGKPYERKPYEGRTYERKPDEGRTYEKKSYEQKPYAGRTTQTFYEKKQSQPLLEDTDKGTPDITETKKKFDFNNNNERDSGRKPGKISYWKDKEEEEKKSKTYQVTDESAGLWPKLPDRTPSRNKAFEQANSDDDDLNGEILDDETKQIIGNVFDTDDAEIGFIGAGAKQQQQQSRYSQPASKPSKPFASTFEHSFEPFKPPKNMDQSPENSDFTSEDEKGFYNYFGNYSRPQNDPFQDNSQSNLFSFFSNKPDTSNVPALGLFQTKRKSSRYDTYSYFPASTKTKTQESPRRKFSNLNKTPFYTGSEDESGVFSESSYSSKAFYNGNDDDDQTPKRTFKLAGDNNQYNFANSFFPNIVQSSENVHKPNPELSAFEQEESNDGIDESNLNFFFSDGVRFRNLKESQDAKESDLPPGLQ